MHKFVISRAVLLALALTSPHAGWGHSSQAAEPAGFKLTVHTGQPGPRFSPTMHGVFFEDINYAADGGLYAELIQNRSFEHRSPLYAWRPTSDDVTLRIADQEPLHHNNPTFLAVTVAKGAAGGAINDGFSGIYLPANAKHLVGLHLRSPEAAAKATAVVRDADGAEVCRVPLTTTSQAWRYVEAEFTTPKEVQGGSFSVEFDSAGEHHVDMVSLFPADTFRGRRNGLRKDLAELLEGMKPTFVRFPGGCIVEGDSIANAYRWKDTVGPIWQRKQNYNLWTNRQSPQYHQTYGLGFFEYFQFCEDIGAEAVPIVNCGMACQARRAPAVPMAELGPWIQDALDLIEFANGPIDSKWGGLRAEMGHPEPFNVKYLGVGNEQWMEGYFERYLVFHNALRARYPDLQIISTSGPQANDSFYKYAWSRFNKDVQADIVDEHYYRSPHWFLSNNHRYDAYDRRGPKVFAGEFAAHEADRASTLRAAVSEAAFMTGLWRNADVVTMASYAPLFAREGNVQWAPDLIWFNDAQSYGTPSYHVQAMFGQNVPDVGVPVTLDASEIPPPSFRGRVGIGTWETEAEFKEVRVTQGDKLLYQSSGDLSEWELFGGEWSAEDGVLRQMSHDTNVRAFVGSEDWSDYTLTLKARRLEGREGFLVSFASTDPRQTSWWNLGGWGNTDHGLEAPLVPQQRTPGAVEPGRWYDVRIDVGPSSVVCYLDGKELQRATLRPTPAIFASAGVDETSGEIIVAVANPSEQPCRGRIELDGASAAAVDATVLTSASPVDVNSFEAPDRVQPQPASVSVQDGAIEHDFPACSFTLLRVAKQ